MPQINVTVSDDAYELITMLCDQTGESKSGIASRLIDEGIIFEIERYNKKRVFRNLVDKSIKTKSEAQ